MANQTQCSSSSAFFAKSSPPFLGKNCVPAYPLSSFENRHQHRPHAKSCAPLEDLLHVINSIQQILGRLAPRILGFADKKCCSMEHVYSCIKIFIGVVACERIFPLLTPLSSIHAPLKHVLSRRNRAANDFQKIIHFIATKPNQTHFS